MITVSELITKLQAYAAQSPENGIAEVVLRYDGDICLEFAGAQDLRGVPGQHFLAFLPNENGTRFGVKEFIKQ